MKRHEALAPLSREHHEALILAQILKKGAPAYKGLPVDTKEKILYALNMYHSTLKDHFIKEESVIAKVQHAHAKIEMAGKEIIDEHRLLEGLFLSLENSKNPEECMNILGSALENHIRKEERVLFSLIQENISDAELDEVSKMLH